MRQPSFRVARPARAPPLQLGPVGIVHRRHVVDLGRLEPASPAVPRCQRRADRLPKRERCRHRWRDIRGYDAGKKINGRKRFIVTDTLGLLLVVVVLSASIQDRDGAKSVLLNTYLRTGVRFVFTDGGFAGRLLDWAQQLLETTVHIVRKPAGQQGFAVGATPAEVGQTDEEDWHVLADPEGNEFCLLRRRAPSA